MPIKPTGGSYPLSMRRGLRLAGVLSAAVQSHATPVVSTTAPPQLPSQTAIVMSYYGSRGASSRSARVLRHRVSAGLVPSSSLRPAADSAYTGRPTSTSCTPAGQGRCSISGGSTTTAMRRLTPVPISGRISYISAGMRNHLSMSASETSRSVADCPAAEMVPPPWAVPRRRRPGARVMELSAASRTEAATGQVVGDGRRRIDSSLDGHNEQESSMKVRPGSQFRPMIAAVRNLCDGQFSVHGQYCTAHSPQIKATLMNGKVFSPIQALQYTKMRRYFTHQMRKTSGI